MDWANPEAALTEHDLSTFDYKAVPKTEFLVAFMWKSDVDKYPGRECLGGRRRCWSNLERDLEEKAEMEMDMPMETSVGTGMGLQMLQTKLKEPASGVYLIACGRAAEVFDEQASRVSDLPFSRDNWESIAKQFHVHRNITRTILRDIAHFSSVRHTPKSSRAPEICYTARMAAALPDDLALSTTYIPSAGITYSVVYGCNDNQMNEIWRRMWLATDHTDHPLLVVGIFMELDRERLIGMAESLADKFTLGSDILENKSWDSTNPKMQGYLEVCLRSRTLIDYIRAAKRQLAKVLVEIDGLERLWHQSKHMVSNARSKAEKRKRQRKITRMLETGEKMKQRIREMLDEYDDKVDECKKMAQNLSLAMQSGWNQIAREDSITNTRISKANTMIALETKRESAQMRSIALLTMIYLPLSCVASVFSTTLFNWNPSDGEPIVSKYIWVLLTLALVLTLITVLAWHFTTNQEKKREGKRSRTFDTVISDAV